MLYGFYVGEQALSLELFSVFILREILWEGWLETPWRQINWSPVIDKIAKEQSTW